MTCKLDTSPCHFVIPAGTGGQGFEPDAGADVPLGPSMSCMPGTRCQLSGAGICAADGKTCAFCSSHAQCSAAYGPGWVCVSGNCGQQ
jgi:hypothetical protein